MQQEEIEVERIRISKLLKGKWIEVGVISKQRCFVFETLTQGKCDLILNVRYDGKNTFIKIHDLEYQIAAISKDYLLIFHGDMFNKIICEYRGM